MRHDRSRRRFDVAQAEADDYARAAESPIFDAIESTPAPAPGSTICEQAQALARGLNMITRKEWRTSYEHGGYIKIAIPHSRAVMVRLADGMVLYQACRERCALMREIGKLPLTATTVLLALNKKRGR